MGKTANYGLPQWEKSDFIKMDDFNAAFGKLDTALKAETDARTAADQSSAETVTAIAQTIANGKICRVKYGSYTGNGTYGAANPVSIECGFCPLLVVVKESTAYQYWMLHGYNKFSGANSRENVVSWGDTGVSWYYPKEDQYFPPAGNQLNSSDTVYHYLVLGCDAEN